MEAAIKNALDLRNENLSSDVVLLKRRTDSRFKISVQNHSLAANCATVVVKKVTNLLCVNLRKVCVMFLINLGTLLVCVVCLKKKKCDRGKKNIRI